MHGDLAGNLRDLAGKHLLKGILIIYIAVYFLFFPSFYSSTDEHHYLANSLQIQRGFLGETSETSVCNANRYTSNGYTYAQYIGRSVFLIPFTWLGIEAVMFSGMVIHLLNFLLLLLIFKKLRVNCLFSLLYLFFPIIFWQSRTLYAGLLVLTGFLAAFYFYISSKEKHWVLSGVFLGFAILARYDAALGVGGLLLALLLKNRRKFLFLLSGFLPALLAILLFNSLIYGSPMSAGYNYPFDLLYSTIFGRDPIAIIFHLSMLFAFYPLMLISPYLVRRFDFKSEYLLFTIPYILLAARYNPLHFNASLLTVFLRMRYILPLAGMLLVPYGFLLQEIFERLKNRKKLLFAGFWLALAVLLAGTVFASMVHSDFLDGRRAVFKQVYANTPENALLIGSSDDCIYIMNGFFPEKRYISVDLNAQLAGNPEGLELEQFIDEKTYVIDLRYSNRVPGSGGRQDTTDKERAIMQKFIQKNKEKLKLVFEATEPHHLKIYRYEE